ncbi:helix-turn-helix domain-containing protein [Heliobacterium chlorum]|uniref:Helix-turn-helix domain-containing protein n=1 Tax=Heliobacterium chlorum TaxID=2698 RepID=A0ABR7T6C3_HELCL|nr:phBC6A51 family helix-turn-helix protein [Heliobacterium chlorum]MBC9786317.1 helix-turn-helix domain-containing protein [Heliobacterium chlorum]
MSDQSKKYAMNGSQRLAAEILASNDVHKMTLAQIADEAGISERTLYRWKQDPDFIAYQNEVAELAMKDFLAEAYNSLKSIARGSQSEKNKLKAIELVMKNQGRLTEVQKVEAKIEDSRSNESIEAEIDNLKKMLADI